MSKQTITINGTVYDRVSGLPIRTVDTSSAGPPRTNRGHAAAMHARTQRSQTLSRKHVKRRPLASAPARTQIAVKQAKPVIQRSPMISKYAPHPTSAPTPQPKRQEQPLTPASVHPVVQKAATNQPRVKRAVHPAAPEHLAQQPVKRTHKPSDIIKAEATAKALANAPVHNRSTHRNRSPRRSRKQLFGRAMSFATSGVALLLIAGYFTYINMPNLSVRVAAVQAGVDASYPSYRPSGYSLSGPVAFENGEVRMAFAGHGTDQGFTLTQSKSGWDSSAVLDNYVQPKAGNDYSTTTAGGLTVYSWGGNAAWVSKGILYTIDGDAPLSPDQVQRIATSL